MIVAKAVGANKQNIIVVGLTEKDITEMRQGLTKNKDGATEYGFHQLIVFMGDSDQAMIDQLSQAGTVRRDNMNPNAGSG